MVMDRDFLSMMIPGITIKPFTSFDGYGTRTFGTPIVTPGHIRYARRSVRKSADEIILATATVDIPPPGFVTNGDIVPLVANESEVLLPDDRTPRHVLEAILVDDEQGHHHQVLRLT